VLVLVVVLVLVLVVVLVLVLVVVLVLVLDSASSRVQSVPHDISRMQSTRGRLPYLPAPARGFALYPTR
jgi:Flp pilus assembly protein protease CpaA